MSSAYRVSSQDRRDIRHRKHVGSSSPTASVRTVTPESENAEKNKFDRDTGDLTDEFDRSMDYLNEAFPRLGWKIDGFTEAGEIAIELRSLGAIFQSNESTLNVLRVRRIRPGPRGRPSKQWLSASQLKINVIRFKQDFLKGLNSRITRDVARWMDANQSGPDEVLQYSALSAELKLILGQVHESLRRRGFGDLAVPAPERGRTSESVGSEASTGGCQTAGYFRSGSSSGQSQASNLARGI
ncbi:MAG: hypothetical protein M1828_002467 [Chrysothrix sp. TS-e1954]|nr:MAG: hypothetical protein M1828_002467 [Chrysothrix sp. TS-e1954]